MVCWSLLLDQCSQTVEELTKVGTETYERCESNTFRQVAAFRGHLVVLKALIAARTSVKRKCFPR